ncbi:MAG: fumarylacetoacetate hydrolase family protein [Vicinamibacterales bacterium]
MRYVTFSSQDDSTQRLGVIDGGEVVDVQSLSSSSGFGELPRSLIEFIGMGSVFWGGVADMLAKELPRHRSGRHAFDRIHWHAPIPRPAKNIFCLGLNYKSHAIESATARGRTIKIPDFPVFFTKATTSVNGPFDEIAVDRTLTQQPDWEVELGVVIGVPGRNVTRAQALRHVFGYTIVNDVTARDIQAKHLQWFKGKSLDGFCPIGPCVVTSDEFGEPGGKRITLRVNGETKQDANTSELIFPVDVIIEQLSEGLTLEAGDIIATGTPEGIGLGQTPPQFLQNGDLIEAEIEGIGIMRNRVRDIG